MAFEELSKDQIAWQNILVEFIDQLQYKMGEMFDLGLEGQVHLEDNGHK